MVQEVAAKHKIGYHEPGFLKGNLMMWRALNETATAARTSKRGATGFYESAVWHGLSLAG